VLGPRVRSGFEEDSREVDNVHRGVSSLSSTSVSAIASGSAELIPAAASIQKVGHDGVKRKIHSSTARYCLLLVTNDSAHGYLLAGMLRLGRWDIQHIFQSRGLSSIGLVTG
jgi:hypothetical protein